MFTLTGNSAFLADMKSHPIKYEQQQYWTWTSHSHTSNIMPERLAKRVRWTKSRQSSRWIFTRLNPLQSSFILIHFRYGPNTCAREVRARCSFALSRKSHRNHRSWVWTEAVSGTIFVPAQKPSGRLWTISLNNGNLFMVGQWSVPEYSNNFSSIIINVVSEETL